MNNQSNTLALIKLIGFSLLGIFLFFMPIEIAGKNTIAFDHMASYLVKEQKKFGDCVIIWLNDLWGN